MVTKEPHFCLFQVVPKGPSLFCFLNTIFPVMVQIFKKCPVFCQWVISPISLPQLADLLFLSGESLPPFISFCLHLLLPSIISSLSLCVHHPRFLPTSYTPLVFSVSPYVVIFLCLSLLFPDTLPMFLFFWQFLHWDKWHCFFQWSRSSCALAGGGDPGQRHITLYNHSIVVFSYSEMNFESADGESKIGLPGKCHSPQPTE